MGLQPRKVSPLAIAGIGSTIIAFLIGTALHPPSGSPDGTFAAPEGSFVVVNDPVTVNCPDVVIELRIVPAAAHPLVTAEVAYLRRDLADANIRLTRDPGQTVDQLNDIIAERKSAIERIIREVVKAGGSEPVGLRDLAACSVQRVSGGVGEATSTIGIEESVAADDSAGQATPSKRDEAEDSGTKTAAPTPSRSGGGGDDDAGKPDAGQTDEPDENEGGSQPGDEPEGDGDRTPTVSCPTVASRLRDVPRAAEAEVDRNLAELERQIDEADARLADLAAHPVDDPNFAQNTILRPLRDRRIATIDRITIAISRVTTPPSNLATLAPCTLSG